MPFAPGDVAVEAGSAPGGASLYLLERGVSVFGIDSALMSPAVLAFDGRGGGPRFVHLQRSVGQVQRADLPARVDWLLMDINAEPDIALGAVEPLAKALWKTLSGVVLTLKMNDWSLAARLDAYTKRVVGFGVRRVVVRQLSQNRREVVAYGLTAKGQARAHGGMR